MRKIYSPSYVGASRRQKCTIVALFTTASFLSAAVYLAGCCRRVRVCYRARLRTGVADRADDSCAGMHLLFCKHASLKDNLPAFGADELQLGLYRCKNFRQVDRNGRLSFGLSEYHS